MLLTSLHLEAKPIYTSLPWFWMCTWRGRSHDYLNPANRCGWKRDGEIRAWCCTYLQIKGHAAYEIPSAKWTKGFVTRNTDLLPTPISVGLIEVFQFQSTVQAWINLLIKQCINLFLVLFVLHSLVVKLVVRNRHLLPSSLQSLKLFPNRNTSILICSS